MTIDPQHVKPALARPPKGAPAKSAPAKSVPVRSDIAENSHILDVINDVFARHRDGTLSDLGSLRALSAFITAYPGGDLLSADDEVDFDAYLDLALRTSQRATSSYDVDTATCARVVMGIAVGNAAALKAVRRTAKAASESQIPVDCV
jgi:hypothetical protein